MGWITKRKQSIT